MSNAESLIFTQPSEREVRVQRRFDAPPSTVFDALTQPDLLRRWLPPEGGSLSVCDVDLRVGGAWRFVVRGADGGEIGMSGTYRELTPGQRMVSSEKWDGFESGESIVTTSVALDNDMAMLTTMVLYPSQEIRDAVVQAGLEKGLADGYIRLAAVLKQA